jgi:hypothetical protein
LTQIEGAHELSLSDIAMPLDVTGTASFKACASCSNVSLRATSQTRYELNGSTVGLADFLAAIASIRDADGAGERAFVGVYYDLKSNFLTRISVLENP